jgi:hypothetical protein
MTRIRDIAMTGALALAPALPAAAGTPQIVAESGAMVPSYSAAADLVLKSPLIVDATIRSATRIQGPEAASVARDRARFYIEVDVGVLIRGNAAIAPRLGYVADVPLDFRGRPPKLRKQRVLLFARAIPGSVAQIQLTDLDGQRNWVPEVDALVRRIATEAAATSAPPAITGIGNAFHVPGTLPGEGESQIFLTTASNDSISLLVLRRPGEQPRWTVALGEIVEDAAPPPPRDTLLWYRLACGLPATLPDTSLGAEEPANAAIAREDYAFVIGALGPCRR